MTLNHIRPGASCVVVAVRATGALRHRLFDMGLTPGAEIKMRKLAPLGDPIEISLRGYELSMRKAEAAAVEVEAAVT